MTDQHPSHVLLTQIAGDTTGSNGGKTVAFYESRGLNAPLPVKVLQVWTCSNAVAGIQLTYTDGNTSPLFGSKEGYKSITLSTFEFEDGEVMKTASIFSNGGYARVGSVTRVGGIKFTTHFPNNPHKEGREFEAKLQDKDLQVENETRITDLGSGILMGILGTESRGAAQEISTLGFYILRKVKKAWLSDVQYPSLKPVSDPEAVSAASMQVGQSYYIDNRQSIVSDTLSFERTIKLTRKRTWSSSTTDISNFGFSVSVEAEAPGASIKAGAHSDWTNNTVKGVDSSEEAEEEQKFTREITVGPGQLYTCHFEVTSGRVDTPYTATMNIQLVNNTVIKWPTNGQYISVDHQQVHVVASSDANIDVTKQRFIADPIDL